MARLKIAEIAGSQGLNQSQLQIKSGVTPALLNRYWRNTTESVTLSALSKIASALGVKPGDLIVEDGETLPTTREGKTVVDVAQPGDHITLTLYGQELYGVFQRVEQQAGRPFLYLKAESGEDYHIPAEHAHTLERVGSEERPGTSSYVFVKENKDG